MLLCRSFYFIFTIVISATLQTSAQQYDLVITGGKIIDGSGNPWYYGDIAIKDGRIAAIGSVNSKGLRTLNAKGLIVSPGFIDVHTHIEGNDLKVPTAPNFLFDGVTTVITGNCGSSNTDIAKYFSQLDSVKVAVNVATLIGHNSVRRAVMGDARRDPTPEEQVRMEAMVEQAMRDGAVGFSTGLIYVPGTYSKTPEVIGLATAASKHHGVYASHIRNEADGVKQAIDEAINIGRTASLPVQISHFKVTYKPNWGEK
jgi:N-acyl-D-amino-acid deacylase